MSKVRWYCDAIPYIPVNKKSHSKIILFTSQLTFICLKSITETLEKGVNMLEINNKTPERHQCLIVLIINLLHISLLFSSISVVDFEQVNVS